MFPKNSRIVFKASSTFPTDSSILYKKNSQIVAGGSNTYHAIIQTNKDFTMCFGQNCLCKDPTTNRYKTTKRFRQLVRKLTKYFALEKALNGIFVT